MNLPGFEENLSFLNEFILELVDDYDLGRLNSWEELDEKVKGFFTPERMDQTEALVPGWKKMASYSDGITLTHVMCVFLGVFMMPEFHALSAAQQQMAKWIVLFHDLAKSHIPGKKDSMHAFNSAALTAKGLASFGFPITKAYPDLIDAWSEFTVHALIAPQGDASPRPDNRKLPKILDELNQLYGTNTPATLITKTVLFHISLDIDPEYPTPAPLTEYEIKRFIDPALLPLLRVMNLGDNEGWAMFEPEGREHLNAQTRAAFQKFERLIAA